jgi:hypothetical protein
VIPCLVVYWLKIRNYDSLEGHVSKKFAIVKRAQQRNRDKMEAGIVTNLALSHLADA